MRPRVAVFDLTCCEGCELQILNCEEELPDLVAALDIVEFREAMTGRVDDCDIAFIDGACSRRSEVAALKEIRRRSKMVIPIGRSLQPRSSGRARISTPSPPAP
jgi:coenzyme F420-reducing hydrogenase gamma subunit